MSNKMSMKTHLAIKAAFSELVKEKKSFNNITVTDITRKADINRSTFYAHYDNIASIIGEYRDEILSVIYSSSVASPKEYYDLVFAYVEAKRPIFVLLLEGAGVESFIGYLAQLASMNLIERMKIVPESKKALQLSMLCHGITTAIVSCVYGKSKETLEEIQVAGWELMEKFIA